MSNENINGIIYTGVPSAEELAACPGIPTKERMRKGRVACVECVQEIPCNPCEGICHFGAITVGEQITDLPRLDEEKCTGCGLCVANCPGLAITILDMSYSETEATIDFPFEYLPLPAEGDLVDAVGRDGAVLCKGRILRVKKLSAYAGTAVITMAIPQEYVMDVRSMKRLPRAAKADESVEPAAKAEPASKVLSSEPANAPDDSEDILICRCQEVRKSEVLAAIRDGAVTVDGVKRRTRAGMGLCQGKTCGRLIERLIAQETGISPAEILPQKSRMPVRPVKIGSFE